MSDLELNCILFQKFVIAIQSIYEAGILTSISLSRIKTQQEEQVNFLQHTVLFLSYIWVVLFSVE